MSFSEAITWEKMRVDINLDENGNDWTLQINPIDRRGSSYVVSGRIDQFQIISILSWARRLGYTDLFCTKFEAELRLLFTQAASSTVMY